MGTEAQYASTSKLSKGTWVKVETPAEGIYQFTFDQLRQMGFSNPARVQVYGIGGTGIPAIKHSIAPYADDLVATPTLRTADRLLFFGTGTSSVSTQTCSGDLNDITVVKNEYDNRSYYFLSDSQGPLEVEQGSQTSASGSTLSNHISITCLEEDLFTPLEGGAGFLGQRYSPGQTASFTFPIKDFTSSPEIPCGNFTYQFAVTSVPPTRLSTSIPESVELSNNYDSVTEALPTTDLNIYRYAKGYADFTSRSIADGDYTFYVHIPAEEYSFCAAERTMLRYPRLNAVSPSSPFVVMNLPKGYNTRGRSFVFPDAAEQNIHMWIIDNLAEIFEVPGVERGPDKLFVLDRECHRAVAFDASATFPTPIVEGNVSATNFHAVSTPEMLIISTPAMMKQANDLADLHRRYQGMDVMVVDHNELFNEFSYGSRHPMAYRRFVKMLYDRNPERLRYLLFIGPAHFDQRGLLSKIDNPEERLAVFEQDDPSLWTSYTTNYTTDAYFAMLDDSYIHKDIQTYKSLINVGRISLTTAQQVANYVAKVKDRLENPVSPSVAGRILLASGWGNNGTHTQHQCEVDSAMRAANPKLQFEHQLYHLFPDADTRALMPERIATILDEGVGYFTYSGHGSDVSINVWDKSRASATAYDHAPMVMFSSCDQFGHDRMASGLVETMLAAPRGGAIAGVGACRSVLIAYNQLMCKSMAAAYASAKPGETLGELYTRARNTAIDDYNNKATRTRALRNMLAYNYGGDPAIPAWASTCGMEITKVNSTEATPSAAVAVPPLEKVVLTGRVLSADGTPDNSFNGTAELRLFDGTRIEPITNIDNEEKFSSRDVEIDDLLGSFTGTITGGVFTVEFTTPRPSRDAAFNKILISAVDPSGNIAAGLFTGMLIDRDSITVFPPEMLTPPEILSMSVTPGEFVGSKGTATITAHIDPSPTGLVYHSGELGSASRAIIDVINIKNDLSAFARTVDGTLVLNIPVRDLAEGSHNVELILVNNASKSARATASFEIERVETPAKLSAPAGPARENVRLSLSGAASGKLVITDIYGNTVHTTDTATFPYEWDLKDKDKTAVANGRYTATVLINDGSSTRHSSCTFTVLHE